jgi:hypothetical protein
MGKLNTHIEKETNPPRPANIAPGAGDAGRASQDGDAVDGMDRVREILFGSQMREHDEHLRMVDEKIRAEVTSLGAELRTRIDAVDNYIRTELNALSDRLKVESEERRNGLKALQSQSHAEYELAKKAAEELSEVVQRSLRETREFVSGESRMLSDRLGQTSRKLLEELARVETTLTQSKVDKRALAASIGGLALQIDESSGSRTNKESNERTRRD